ncbi:MAG: acyl-CoA dehydrogenase family protein, partial [Nitrospinae bacterium]|nr:acyl-CoA dehydrogenase family protein [Nitrospinota bacterium]
MVDYILDDELKAWQGKVAEFAKNELKPYAAEWDRQNGVDPANPFPMDALKKASAAGIRTLTTPR